jgi:hypothetical protein
MTFKLLSDDYFDQLFSGTNFGETINSSTEEKKKYIAKSLRKSIDGYWLGHTIFAICINGGFLIDNGRGDTRLTNLGRALISHYK